MDADREPTLLVSIVSHGQALLIRDLLGDLKDIKPHCDMHIVLTINIAEDESAFGEDLAIVDSIIRNESPRGFGANHNAAFQAAECDVFVVLNPDIRMTGFEFALLVENFRDAAVGAVAPLVLSASGEREDSFRRFPTLMGLARRFVTRRRPAEYDLGDAAMQVDWVAGMFIAFGAEAFTSVGGFDQRYFMYLEDADICRAMQAAGRSIVIEPRLSVIHDAQRASSKSFTHLKWHVNSALRFLLKWSIGIGR